MAHLVFGDNAYPASFTVPDDGDEAYAASVNGAFSALADRTAWANDRLANGIKRIRFVWTTAALKALNATTGDVCVLLGASDIPAGIYIYSVGPFMMGYSVDDAPWQYASTAVSGAMWFNALYWQIGGATDSIATVGSDGRLKAKGPNAIRSIGFVGTQSTQTIQTVDPGPTPSTSGGDVDLNGTVSLTVGANDIVTAEAAVEMSHNSVTATPRTEVKLWRSTGGAWTEFAISRCDLRKDVPETRQVRGTFRVDPGMVGTATLQVKATAALTYPCLGATVATNQGLRVQVVQP